jgi:hypothetical protein
MADCFKQLANRHLKSYFAKKLDSELPFSRKHIQILRRKNFVRKHSLVLIKTKNSLYSQEWFWENNHYEHHKWI